MKRPVILATTLAAMMLSFDAGATEPTGPSYTSETPPPVAGLAWRCGKNNPAMWGTFGNGCLKQKRKAKQNSSALGNGDLMIAQ